MEEKSFPETILYELLFCGEWKDEREEQVSQLVPKTQSGLFSYINPTKLLKRRQLSVGESVKWLKYVGPPWRISISPDGNTVAILQDLSLETRCSKDNFLGVEGRTIDPFTTCRMMCWSLDSTILAISFSNGQIIFYDSTAVQLSSVRRCALPSQEEKVNLFTMDNALSGLIFSKDRVKKLSYTNELISVDMKGQIKCFRQTSADQFTFHHEATIRSYYPKGVYTVAAVEANGVLLISGALEMTTLEDTSQRYGISGWRLLNDSPHYKIAFNVANDEFKMDTRRKWRFAVSALFPDSSKIDVSPKKHDAVFKMTLSPKQTYLAALHTSGTISIWHIPSLKIFRIWPLKNQFHHWTENPNFNNRWRVAFNRCNEEPIDSWRFHPQDLNWWNDDIVIVSRVNGCVSLFSTEEVYPTKNLLGDFPEVFKSPVLVTSRRGKGFLALECEFQLKMEKKRDPNGTLIQLSETDSIELLDAYDSQYLPKTIAQEILFWMTDIERFRPPRKRKKKPPVWIETHRLILLRNITPQELFHQKIEAEEYGEALDLARAYKLDSDLVYQRQWSKSPVSIHTIRDYLAKIKKRNWILEECLERVPPNPDAARELLTFGLRGTDLSAAVLISQGKDVGMFQMLTPDDLDISNQEYLMLVDADNLEVKRLLSFRKKFLFYVDMLETYELMLGGGPLVEENFDGNVFAQLRTRSPIENAVRMARESDVASLRIMLRYHWFQILPEYLTVLSSFPETFCPDDYNEFLPEIRNDGKVHLFDGYVTKTPDWCEQFLPNETKLHRSALTSNGYTEDQIFCWYEDRVHEIEKLSGITSYALDLARLGMERNVKGLLRLVQDLEVVEIMVYDAKVEVTLDELEELGPIDRLQILMSNSDEKNFIAHMINYVVPFLEKCELQEKGSRFHILDQYLSSISTESLSKSLLIFENSRSGSSNQIIPDPNELMRVAYSCIYACTNPKQLENILAILNCLPERHRALVPENLKALHDLMDDLERNYQGMKILDKYNYPLTLQELMEKSSSEDIEIEPIFQRICDFPRLTKPPLKIQEWKTLLYDVLDLQKKVFKTFPMERCFELYVTALLRSGTVETISLARDFIDRKQQETEESSTNSFKSLMRRVSSAYSTSFALYLYLIPYSTSLEMVIAAAQHYFDSASNYSDPDIELCKACLNLMQNPKQPSISMMFDLIDAIKIINKDFQLNILPQNVRITREKAKLLKQSMDNTPDGYKKTRQLLKLAVLLKINEEEQDISEMESWLLEMSGNAALIAEDMKFCVYICENIIAKGYQTGWKVLTNTANYQSDATIIDDQTRLVFISYALNMCPDEEIMNILEHYALIRNSLQDQETKSRVCICMINQC